MSVPPEKIIDTPGVYRIGTSSGFWPEPYFNNERIVGLDSGYSHSAILTETGRVYTWGENNFGQLGLEDVGGAISEPTLVATLALIHIVGVVCGSFFTLFLSKQGEVFACGENTYGQLGLGHRTDTKLPTRVPVLEHVDKMAAGFEHAVAMTSTGEVWVAGNNNYGQLGLGNTTAQATFVRVTNLLGSIEDVACGSSHTVLLSSFKVIWSSGWNKHGQLGLGTKADTRYFIPLVLPSPVTAIGCGNIHTAALTEGGVAWVWGNDWNNKDSSGFTSKNTRPYKLMGGNISSINAGYYYTGLLTTEGEVLVCGDGRYVKLGMCVGNVLEPAPWQTTPDLVISHMTYESQGIWLSVMTQPKYKTSLYLDWSSQTSNLIIVTALIVIQICVFIFL